MLDYAGHAQTKFSLSFPCNLSYPNNSINLVITDMNQAVLANIRLFLALLKMILKISAGKNKLNA